MHRPGDGPGHLRGNLPVATMVDDGSYIATITVNNSDKVGEAFSSNSVDSDSREGVSCSEEAHESLLVLRWEVNGASQV